MGRVGTKFKFCPFSLYLFGWVAAYLLVSNALLNMTTWQPLTAAVISGRSISNVGASATMAGEIP